jgi:Family of unknown function (DUF5681)
MPMSDTTSKPDDGGNHQRNQGTRFQPGRSGNPKGRPKGSRNFRTELNEVLTASIAVREGGRRKKISRQRALLLALFEKAIHGDPKAADSLVKLAMTVGGKNGAEPEKELAETVTPSDAAIVADFLTRNQRNTHEGNDDGSENI